MNTSNRFVQLLKTNIRNRFYYFPMTRVRMLEKRIRDLEQDIEKQKSTMRLLAMIRSEIEKPTISRKKKEQKAVLWFEMYKRKLKSELGRCEKCGHDGSFSRLTLDHIIPRTVLKDFGVDPTTYIEEENFQLLCESCNQKKGFSLDFTNPKTKPLLEGLLKTIQDAPVKTVE